MDNQHQIWQLPPTMPTLPPTQQRHTTPLLQLCTTHGCSQAGAQPTTLTNHTQLLFPRTQLQQLTGKQRTTLTTQRNPHTLHNENLPPHQTQPSRRYHRRIQSQPQTTTTTRPTTCENIPTCTATPTLHTTGNYTTPLTIYQPPLTKHHSPHTCPNHLPPTSSFKQIHLSDQLQLNVGDYYTAKVSL